MLGNLDEKVSERVLYEILIQAGHVVDLHIPVDKETNRRKGFAFAEYESEEIAEYAVKLFTGLVCLNKKMLKFGMSGSDKLSKNISTPESHSKHPSNPNASNNNNYRPSPLSVNLQDRQSTQVYALTPNAMVPNAIVGYSSHQASPNGLYNNGLRSVDYNYSRRVLGSALNGSRTATRDTIPYPLSY